MTNEQRIKKLSVPQGRVDVVLDTDAYNEIDDQFAISYLLKSKEKLTAKAIYAAPFFNINSKNEAISFAETVKPLLQELDASPNLSLYGGVFRNNSLFKECFCNEISKAFNNITIDLLTTPAEEGALKVAMEL